MLAIQVRGGDGSEEELRAVGVRPGVGHAQQTRFVVLHKEGNQNWTQRGTADTQKQETIVATGMFDCFSVIQKQEGSVPWSPLDSDSDGETRHSDL